MMTPGNNERGHSQHPVNGDNQTMEICRQDNRDEEGNDMDNQEGNDTDGECQG